LTSQRWPGKPTGMLSLPLATRVTLLSSTRSRADLLLEIFALRQQLEVYRRQVREATLYGVVPRFLLHDNDGIFGQLGRPWRVEKRLPGRRYRCSLDAWLDQGPGVCGLPIPYDAPNANPHVERSMRTLREECLRNFIFLSEGHLRRTVAAYVRYFNGGRVHQGIDGIPAPEPGALAPPRTDTDFRRVESRPVLGGLIRDYRLAA